MKYNIILLFLKREHLILLTKISLLNQQDSTCESKINSIELEIQRQEKLLLKSKWTPSELDFIKQQILQIANLTFSYYKLHFPINSSVSIKEHIKFIQIIKHLNYNGTILNDIFKQQRCRLQFERMKLLKSQKLIDEPIHPKIANYKIDYAYVQYLFNRYYNPKTLDYKQPYQILNLLVKKKMYRINNRVCMSITSLEDVPQLQLINTNLIQPILNYDQFNSTFEKRMNKLMNRNSQIQQSILQYNHLYYNQRSSFQNCKTSDDLPILQRQKLNQNFESDILILPDHRTQRTNYRFAKLLEKQENKNLKSINIKDQMEFVLMQKIKRHHTSSEREDSKQISRSQFLRSVKSEHLLIEQEIFFKKILQPIKEQKFKIKQNK
ncbi:unnamed protein product [Paramecium sonneborni]|uniref:Uncharacterized protein n=1 Tax=Paramecium sonneborni TaxID=65129 RepID=A0A8S1K8H0_9CILI|nr:unnamed protein product [Paramecium sonneborni]